MLRKFKTLAATTGIAATALVCLATQASAATLYTIIQSPGSDPQISGSFEYDPSASAAQNSQSYSNIAISTSGGNTATYPPTLYTVHYAEDLGNYLAASTQSNPNDFPLVELSFPTAVTGQPGDTEVANVAEVIRDPNSGNVVSRSFSGVTVTDIPAAVPEPSSTSSIGLVILGCGGWLVKRKIAQAAES